MKNLKLIFPFVVILAFSSCKKEISETEKVKSIKAIVAKKEVVKDDFNQNILPLIKELYEKDSTKYSMLNHIAKKASKEKNKDIYKINVANLKEELKYY